MEGWEELSDWYDKKQGETGDLWHRALIDPALLKVIGQCRGLNILDLGCGNGYLARKFAKDGAEVVAVDSSPRMIQNAKAHDANNKLRIRYVQANANKLVGVADGSVDLVYANMSLMDFEDAEGVIREVSRVLKPRGRFVASISHPCFDQASQSGWLLDKQTFEPAKVYRKVRSYRTPFSEKIRWRLENGEWGYTTTFHRPLSWYVNILHNNGLAITSLVEPMPTEEFLKKESEKGDDLDARGFLEVPLHLVFDTVKV